MKVEFNAARLATLVVSIGVLSACSTAVPKPTAEFHNFKDFDRSVQISAVQKHHAPKPAKSVMPRLARITKAVPPRRPQTDPYKVGEQAIFTMKFTGVSAGELIMETKPFVTVNNRKAYNFMAQIKTNKVFSMFFKINDSVNLYYDFEDLVPLTTTLHAEESKKLQETRTYYNWAHLKADEWENSLLANEPLKARNKHWDIKPFSQSLFSAIYYLRTQTLTPGTTIEFPVSHDEKNFNFKAEVLRKETIQTQAGSFNTIVVKASEAFTELFNKSKGDTMLWLTDDDRKLLVKLEAPLKFGKLSGQLKTLTLQ